MKKIIYFFVFMLLTVSVVASGGGDINGECGELHIRESSSERVIPAGIYVRFVR